MHSQIVVMEYGNQVEAEALSKNISASLTLLHSNINFSCFIELGR